MGLIFIRSAQREIQKVPAEFRAQIYFLLECLRQGEKLSLPISRPLFNIVRGLHELRLSDKAGELRVFYYLYEGDIYVVHSGLKKKQTIDYQTKSLILNRIKGI